MPGDGGPAGVPVIWLRCYLSRHAWLALVAAGKVYTLEADATGDDCFRHCPLRRAAQEPLQELTTFSGEQARLRHAGDKPARRH